MLVHTFILIAKQRFRWIPIFFYWLITCCPGVQWWVYHVRALHAEWVNGPLSRLFRKVTARFPRSEWRDSKTWKNVESAHFRLVSIWACEPGCSMRHCRASGKTTSEIWFLVLRFVFSRSARAFGKRCVRTLRHSLGWEQVKAVSVVLKAWLCNNASSEMLENTNSRSKRAS